MFEGQSPVFESFPVGVAVENVVEGSFRVLVFSFVDQLGSGSEQFLVGTFRPKVICDLRDKFFSLIQVIKNQRMTIYSMTISIKVHTDLSEKPYNSFKSTEIFFSNLSRRKIFFCLQLSKAIPFDGPIPKQSNVHFFRRTE